MTHVEVHVRVEGEGNAAAIASCFEHGHAVDVEVVEFTGERELVTTGD